MSTRWINAADVERVAEAVLVRHKIGRPPVDVDRIAELDGLRWEYADLAGVGGMYYNEGPGHGVATINAREHPLRQRFTKAHELAHHLLDGAGQIRAAGLGHLTLPSGYRGRDSHWAHDRFAAALLMPRAWIGAYMRDHGWKLERPQLVADIAREFRVSRRAAEVRLEKLGHIERSAS